jgi:hypothetical protein
MMITQNAELDRIVAATLNTPGGNHLMRWTIRSVSADTVERTRAMAEHFGSHGAVVDEAVGRLYEAEDWHHWDDSIDLTGIDPAWSKWLTAFETHNAQLHEIIATLKRLYSPE